jgi:ADP-ribose pyrophosphatase
MEKKPGDNVVYSGKIFSIELEGIPLPNGDMKIYERINIQNAVTILPIDAQKRVYMVEQYRIGAHKSLLELPAGKVEHGEDPFSTAGRELREEIGMSAGDMKHLGNFYMTPGYASEYMYCYMARNLEPAPLQPDMDEFINIHRIPLMEIYRMIEHAEIEDSKTLAAFMLARPFLEL